MIGAPDSRAGNIKIPTFYAELEIDEGLGGGDVSSYNEFYPCFCGGIELILEGMYGICLRSKVEFL